MTKFSSYKAVHIFFYNIGTKSALQGRKMSLKGKLMWNKNVQLHRKIAPELIVVIEERYDILRNIQDAEPVGRRALAVMLEKGERSIRAQVEFLKNAGFLDISPLGMTLTPEGKSIQKELSEYIKVLHGLTVLEGELSKKLGIKQVMIIPGDSELNNMVGRELGRAAAHVLDQYLTEHNMIVAVSGGTSMANVAEAVNFSRPNVTVVPARGGLGGQVEHQANSIAASMATKLGGKYHMLHLPDGVSEEMVATMAMNKDLLTVADMIKQADVLIHGIGCAHEMAVRRGLDECFIAEIINSGAVGEALGNYCTLTGLNSYITSSVGLQLNNLAEVGLVIAVAGGRKKAEAIIAITIAGGQDVLITDEAAARAIQSII